ncbi:DNA-binding transcriptional regulator YhcF (GntR family) [Microterricola gilva]|uniref:DNA-binding transcriptional regulator YhcF (GntR family) n=1 Tax=Microterricola gilva TaxID=393267 RepID=A0A4V2GAI5_9MICO|nr:DNA-binding transcriptional regulator YhcF (GntR family) [Microterricola gilva]
MISDDRPIFVQIAERVEDDIIAGELAEESQVPSTNEFAAFYRINPATAGKGVNLLVDDGILYKKRGIGMFVAGGARERLLEKRRARFSLEYLRPLLAEASKLDISPTRLGELLLDEAAALASDNWVDAQRTTSQRAAPQRAHASLTTDSPTHAQPKEAHS